MKTKIQINSFFGSVLFEHAADDNNVKKTITQAVKNGAHLTGAHLTGADFTYADLRCADLTGAHLTGANLTGAHLIGANLTGAKLRGANLTYADLTGAYLTGANLTGANLIGANLRCADLTYADLTGANLRCANLTGAHLIGANLRCADLTGAKYNNDILIQNMAVFTGLYNYVVIVIITKEGAKWIRMGCHLRTIEEWENDFWNNDDEFPNDDSEKSQKRLFAYETAKRWIETIKERNI